MKRSLLAFVAVFFVSFFTAAPLATADGPIPGERETFALVLRDGRTGNPVPDASVAVELPSGTWRSSPASPEGVVTLPGEVFGKPGRVERSGFIPSAFFVGYQWELLPDDQAYPLDYHLDVIIGGDPAGYSFRVHEGATVVFAPDRSRYDSDPRFRDGVREAASKLAARIVRWQITVTVEPGAAHLDPPTRDRIVVPVYEDGGDPIWQEPNYKGGGALTFWVIDGCGYVREAKVLFSSIEAFWGDWLLAALLHEFRHVAGLIGHSPRDASDSPRGDYSSFEIEALWLLGERSPGTGYPDDATRAFCAATPAATTSAFKGLVEREEEVRIVRNGLPLRPPRP